MMHFDHASRRCASESVEKGHWMAEALLSINDMKIEDTGAGVDVLPTVRFMVKAEMGRKIGLKNGESAKRSRSARFIHYFDTINLCLSETHLKLLESSLI